MTGDNDPPYNAITVIAILLRPDNGFLFVTYYLQRSYTGWRLRSPKNFRVLQ